MFWRIRHAAVGWFLQQMQEWDRFDMRVVCAVQLRAGVMQGNVASQAMKRE